MRIFVMTLVLAAGIAVSVLTGPTAGASTTPWYVGTWKGYTATDHHHPATTLVVRTSGYGTLEYRVNRGCPIPAPPPKSTCFVEAAIKVVTVRSGYIVLKVRQAWAVVRYNATWHIEPGSVPVTVHAATVTRLPHGVVRLSAKAVASRPEVPGTYTPKVPDLKRAA